MLIIACIGTKTIVIDGNSIYVDRIKACLNYGIAGYGRFGSKFASVRRPAGEFVNTARILIRRLLRPVGFLHRIFGKNRRLSAFHILRCNDIAIVIFKYYRMIVCAGNFIRYGC